MMWKQYVNARSLDEAAQLLAEHRERARIVAGATDLLIELDRKTRTGVETLIDISRVAGADEIRLADEWIYLGPMVTHAQACASPLMQQRALPLAQACWEVGAPQIRNRATIAGNVITASPANDTITPLMALDAVVTLHSAASGERIVPLREFYTGVRRTVMQPDELLVNIAFPAMSDDERGTFISLTLRRAQAISVVNVAVVLKLDDGRWTTDDYGIVHRQACPEPVEGSVVKARLALGCVAPTIVRCDEAEQFLGGKALDDDVIEHAGALAQHAAKPIDDIRAPAEYRLDMVKVLVKRALRAIANGEARGILPDKPVMLGSIAANHPFFHPLPQPSTNAQEQRRLSVVINGQPYSLPQAHDKTLLRALREDAELIGTKEGCAEGECGACTVFLDGAAVMSCLVPAPRAHGARVTTVEGVTRWERPDPATDAALSETASREINESDGLSGSSGLHALQQAFVDEGAVQCGYCTPGFIMSGAKLLEERPNATQSEAQEAFSGNLCRCTGYYKILAAFEKAKEMRR